MGMLYEYAEEDRAVLLREKEAMRRLRELAASERALAHAKALAKEREAKP